MGKFSVLELYIYLFLNGGREQCMSFRSGDLQTAQYLVLFGFVFIHKKHFTLRTFEAIVLARSTACLPQLL